MAHNYYHPQQHPQYYKPQNIYQQLGQREPVPRQQPSVYQQPPQPLPQQQPHPPQPPQPPPPQQQQPQYYPYTQQARRSPLHSQWSNPQVQPIPYLQQHPQPTPPQSQRRPLPLPTNTTPTRPQQSQQTPSPTRSRPLPVPTPAQQKPRPASSFIPQQKQQVTPPTAWKRTPSPVKTTNHSATPVGKQIYPVTRGRTSPPRFSTASVPSTSAPPSLSPSPQSTESSLTSDSVSGHPNPPSRLPPRATNGIVNPATGAGKPNINGPLNANTSRATSITAPASAGSTVTEQPKKFVPMWKRTIPDVLPPLYPPPVLTQRAPIQPQPQPQPRPAPAPAPAPAPTRAPARAFVPVPVAAQPPRTKANTKANPLITNPVTTNKDAAVNYSSYGYYPGGYNATTLTPQRSGGAQPSGSVYTNPQRQEESSEEEEEEEAEEVDEEESEESEDEEDEESEGARHYVHGHQPMYAHHRRHPGYEPTDPVTESESDHSEYHSQQPQDHKGKMRAREIKAQNSPQYGIRDLPKRQTREDISPDPVGPLPQPPTMVRNGYGGQSAPAPSRPQSSWGVSRDIQGSDSGGGSRTMRIAAGDARSSGSAGGGGGWPQGLPRLPRIPGGGSGNGAYGRRGIGLNLDLDDTPPPASPSFAMRRSPSPSPVPVLENIDNRQEAIARRRELPQPLQQVQSRDRERPQTQIYASSGSGSSMRQEERARPQSQLYTPGPGPTKQQHGGPRAPSQMQHHHQRQQHQQQQRLGRQREEVSTVSVLESPDSSSRQQTLPQHQRQYQNQPHAQHQPPSQQHSHSQHQPPSQQPPHSQYSYPYQPQNQPQQEHHIHTQPQPQHHPQPQPQLPYQGPSTQPQMKIESPSPIGGRDKLADIPLIELEGAAAGLPMINVDLIDAGHASGGGVPRIIVQDDGDDGGSGSGSSGGGGREKGKGREETGHGPTINVFEVPGISVVGLEESDVPLITVEGQPPPPNSNPNPNRKSQIHPQQRRGGLICGGCDGPIVGRIVNAMGARWHPSCFKCTVCDTLLEHVSSYENEGRAYCHLDYHENFAPRCYSCKTAIIEERFISLDDPALGKRTYHEQHFFCAECGDPFLTPSSSSFTSRTGELNVSGDGDFEADDVGFTVFRGHPYCEACHVRLRLPKCKRCKRSIRDGDQAVEALGGKWCWGCFVCAGCEKPFENPSFFQRGDQPYCEPCFSIILRNDV